MGCCVSKQKRVPTRSEKTSVESTAEICRKLNAMKLWAGRSTWYKFYRERQVILNVAQQIDDDDGDDGCAACDFAWKNPELQTHPTHDSLVYDISASNLYPSDIVSVVAADAKGLVCFTFLKQKSREEILMTLVNRTADELRQKLTDEWKLRKTTDFTCQRFDTTHEYIARVYIQK
jgi:hypothetical protein